MPRRFRGRLRMGRVILIIALVLLLGGFVQGRRLKVTTHRLDLDLPAPVNLAVLADFHISTNTSTSRQAEKAIKIAMEEQPDAILLLGDFVYGKGGIPHLAGALEGIDAPLGVYAVLGNHDHWAGAQEVIEQLEAAGINHLDNESILLTKGQTALRLAGIDDLWSGAVDWEGAFQEVTADTNTVLMSHNPDAALHPRGQTAQLIVSGHTHGGQVKMPRFVKRIFTRATGVSWPPKTKYGYLHPYGLVQEPWGWVYVTSGSSLGHSPPRWYTRPEVALLELQ